MHSFRTLKIAIGVVLLAGISLSVVGGGVGLAQSPATPPAAPATYKPTEIQLLKLQVAQKDAQLAQVQLQRAQQTFQGALAQLDTVAGDVKRENGWPKDVQFSPDTLTFTVPVSVPQLPPSTPEKKP